MVFFPVLLSGHLFLFFFLFSLAKISVCNWGWYGTHYFSSSLGWPVAYDSPPASVLQVQESPHLAGQQHLTTTVPLEILLSLQDSHFVGPSWPPLLIPLFGSLLKSVSRSWSEFLFVVIFFLDVYIEPLIFKIYLFAETIKAGFLVYTFP